MQISKVSKIVFTSEDIIEILKGVLNDSGFEGAILMGLPSMPLTFEHIENSAVEDSAVEESVVVEEPAEEAVDTQNTVFRRK